MVPKKVKEPFFFNLYEAFHSPPYGTSTLKKIDRDILFDQINFELFGAVVSYSDQKDTIIINDLENDFKIHFEVYDWTENTDWCNDFFEAGSEWWGTYCFTIKNRDGDYVVIAASTTD